VINFLLVGNSSLFNRRIAPALVKFENHIKCYMVTRNPKNFNSSLIDSNRVFESIESVLNCNKIDIAYISLPNHLHFETAKILLDANINLIIDKPAILNRREFESLLNIAKKKDLFISESLVYHYHPAWKTFKSVVKECGPSLLEAQFTIPKLPSTNFRNNKKMGGGVINDMGLYMIDICTRFFDSMPIRIHSNIKKDINFLDPIFISAEFKNNNFFNGIFGFNLPYKNYVKYISNDTINSLERVFSPPADYEIIIKNHKNGLDSTTNVSSADVFELYFYYIFNLYRNKKFDKILLEFEQQSDKFLNLKECVLNEKF
jgi:predicted dehydrogenase